MIEVNTPELQQLVRQSRYQSRIEYLLANQHLARIQLKGLQLLSNCAGSVANTCAIEDEIEKIPDVEIKDYVHRTRGNLTIPRSDIYCSFYRSLGCGPGYIGKMRWEYFLESSHTIREVSEAEAEECIVVLLELGSNGQPEQYHTGVLLGKPQPTKLSMFHQGGKGFDFELAAVNPAEACPSLKFRFYKLVG